MPNQERLRETKHHGAVRFPFNIYPCTIPGDFLQVPLHWHDSMELVYVKKGSGIVQVGVNAYPAEQGDIYIFAPGTLHALHQRGQTAQLLDVRFRGVTRHDDRETTQTPSAR